MTIEISDPKNPHNIEKLTDLIDQNTHPLDYLKTLAKEIATIDRKFEPVLNLDPITEDFYNMMAENQFLPNSSIILGATKPNNSILANTALKLTDDFNNIFDALKQTSILLQHNIQVAIDFSNLRASRSQLSSGPRQSLGPVRFMKLFEGAPQQKDQKTEQRYCLRIDHLDIASYFDYIKSHPRNIHFAIGITDEFIHAITNKKSFGLRHKIDQEPSQWVDGNELFKSLTDLILGGKDIDILYVDRIDQFAKTRSMRDEDMIINSENQIISQMEMMSTGVINLEAFIKEGSLNEKNLSKVIFNAIHFLDNCLEKNFYPIEKFQTISKQKRRIGLSFTGIQTFLETFNPEQGDKKTNRILNQLLVMLHKETILASQELGEKRGMKNKIFFQDQWYKTRHCQLLAQIHNPTLEQIMNLQPATNNKSWHQTWQSGLGNLASFKYPLIELNDQNFLKAFTKIHQQGGLSFELDFENDQKSLIENQWAKFA